MNDESIIITDETKAIVEHYLAKRRKAYERRHPEATNVQPVFIQGEPTIKDYIDEMWAWHQQTFKGQTAAKTLLHLREEVEEAIKSPRDPEEYADILMTFISAMLLAGFTIDQIINEMFAKLRVCKRSKWYLSDQGYYKRMKPTFYMAVKEEI